MATPNHRIARYAITGMRRGGFRAECHVEGCGWYADFRSEVAALPPLRIHMREHGVKVYPQAARST